MSVPKACWCGGDETTGGHFHEAPMEPSVTIRSSPDPERAQVEEAVDMFDRFGPHNTPPHYFVWLHQAARSWVKLTAPNGGELDRAAVADALDYMEWIGSVAADWPDIAENVGLLAEAARVWLEGTETQWCERHKVHVRYETAITCTAGAFSDPPSCRIVPARLFVERP